MQTELKQFTTEALEKLSSYSWPDNARQLKNEIKRLVAPVREKSITEDHLDGSIRNLSAFIPSFQPKVEAVPKAQPSRSLPDAVEQLGRPLTEEALRIPAVQRKSGSDARPKPSGVDQEAEAALYSSVNYR